MSPKSEKDAATLEKGWINLRGQLLTTEQLRAKGIALRDRVPRQSHGEWAPATKGRNALSIVMQSNVGRQQNLVPLRMERMAASPFAYLRGAAAVMAFDLSKTPTMGCNVVMAGDAHISNFGLYGTPQRELVFDINDFDETVIGPWEWDLKRLTASVNVAGRDNGLNVRERRSAVMEAVAGYQENLNRLQTMGTLDIWYLHAYPGRDNLLRKVPIKAQAIGRNVME